ncbi:uncharacterized protein LOC131845529 [Achroia grisella]|uniref:uncharacterized protein LOC131845529 n=1 Tax=Achroia grisella TaxID=688607 RepID=UPI0027D28761|nr:uncharacterized protein LOC131845529 [Achroia grisella]
MFIFYCNIWIMDNLMTLMLCENNSCCCLSKRITVVMISLISLAGSLVDMMTTESSRKHCPSRAMIDSVKLLLVTLFQMANLLLLLASFLENSLLVQVYLWYMLGFVVMGFMVTIAEFLISKNREGLRSFISFVPEVAYLFVIYRCLPIVDTYRKLVDTSAVKTYL